ncbi:MAG: hypothetical protein A3D39_05760 [Candidatus Buchananbacteria bacterium RIFCSPHIGHO2_02_FULL_39_17]|nr:MAG: hypothetical protein A3D39_05760 [Candidatus Buchananbacteria bacterium RIFCSPHIGHO2_02_FULL_39_17]
MKKQKKFIILILTLLAISLPLLVLAAENQFNQSTYVGADEIIDGNFIKIGNFIDLQGAINGDVIVAGNSINITGPVAGDIIAAGNVIKIKGPVGGSVRVAGSLIEISNEVERNVWGIANTLTINQEARIGWDVFAGAANVEVKGKVLGNINVSAGNLLIENEIGKNVIAAIDKDGQIILNPQAKINGNLTYQAVNNQQLVIREGAQIIGETKKKEGAPVVSGWQRYFGVNNLFAKVISFFGLLVVGLVLVTIMPKIVLEVRQEMMKKPAPAIGWGLVYLLITPIICFFLAITIIGLPLAIILISIYALALYLTKVFVALTLGLALLNKLSGANKFKGSLIWPLALGLLIFLILISLPIFGWLIKIILMLWAFGALISVKKEFWRQYR